MVGPLWVEPRGWGKSMFWSHRPGGLALLSVGPAVFRFTSTGGPHFGIARAIIGSDV